MSKHGFTRSMLQSVMLVSVAVAAMNMEPVRLAQAATLVTARVEGSDTSTLGGGNQDYGKPNHSRAWYNSHRGRWDALIPKNDGGTQGDDHYIVKDVSGSQTFTPVELEN